MKQYKKTLLGSLFAFVLGTSCWLSSLLIWVGGAAFLGTLARLIEDTQILLLSLAGGLFVVSVWLYFRNRK